MDMDYPLDTGKGVAGRRQMSFALATTKSVIGRWQMSFALLLSLLVPGTGWAGHTPPAWPAALEQRLIAVDAAYPGELGVYVKDLSSGASLSFRGDESWYLASGIKVPVAIALLRGIERGDWALDDLLQLEAGDYVDGAGQTNWHPAGSRLSIRFLLEQMLIHSDNTASDRLIRLVGIDSVNAVARELAPEGLGPITTLADVRRHAYSVFHDGAFALSGEDFFALRNMRDERKRIEVLAKLLQVPAADFPAIDVAAAFESYYATNLNGGRLSAFAQLLEALVQGRALTAESTDYLLGVLLRVETGQRRIKAGLPASTRFAHKTGTQVARSCDLGVAITEGEDGPRHLVVAACTRGTRLLSQSERALRGVGEALEASGVFVPALPGQEAS